MSVFSDEPRVAKEEFFSKIVVWLEWTARIDRSKNQSLLFEEFIGWNTAIVLSVRPLTFVDDTIWGVNLVNIMVDERFLRQGRATRVIAFLLDTIERMPTLAYFRILDIINPNVEKLLERHFKNEFTIEHGLEKEELTATIAWTRKFVAARAPLPATRIAKSSEPTERMLSVRKKLDF